MDHSCLNILLQIVLLLEWLAEIATPELQVAFDTLKHICISDFEVLLVVVK